MGRLQVRVRFERIGQQTRVPDLVTPADGDVAGAIREHVLGTGMVTACTIHVEGGGGWIDAGGYNAGRFTLDDEPDQDSHHNETDDADSDDELDPWIFPPPGL